jgi:hypothetical protein
MANAPISPTAFNPARQKMTAVTSSWLPGSAAIRYASGHFAQENVTPEGSVSASLRRAFHPYLIVITFNFSFRNVVTY